MSKKQTSFVLRWFKKRKKSQLTCQKRLQYRPIFPASLFSKATEEKNQVNRSLFPVSGGRTNKHSGFETEKLRLRKAARPLMIRFLAAKADESLRASLKCIQIEKYGSSESVNSNRWRVCVLAVRFLKVRPPKTCRKLFRCTRQQEKVWQICAGNQLLGARACY